jgi:hypothetical protein
MRVDELPGALLPTLRRPLGEFHADPPLALAVTKLDRNARYFRAMAMLRAAGVRSVRLRPGNSRAGRVAGGGINLWCSVRQRMGSGRKGYTNKSFNYHCCK